MFTMFNLLQTHVEHIVNCFIYYKLMYWWSGGPFGPKEIDGLLVPPGKAYKLLTGDLITS